MSKTSKQKLSFSKEKRELFDLLLNEQNIKVDRKQNVICPRGNNDPSVLSFAQERLWFLENLAPDSPFYNSPVALRLKGILNQRVLERSFHEIVKRHEILRTTFLVLGGQLRQVVAPPMRLMLQVVDLTKLSEDARESEIQKLFFEETRCPFNLTQGPVIRTTLLHAAAEDNIVFSTFHHIVFDGWSMDIFMQELTALYQAFLADKPSPLPPLPIQYADYALWQRQWMQGEVLETEISYWKRYLQDVPTVLNLPTDYPRPARQTFHGATFTFSLPLALMEPLKVISYQEGASLFMTLLAVFEVLLSRYTAQEDFLVGTPITNRNQKETEALIGFFVNTLVLRAHLSTTRTFRDLLRQIRETTLEAYAHQELPFDYIVDALRTERDLSRNPLFQVLFMLDHEQDAAPPFAHFEVDTLTVDMQISKFDLSLSLTETRQGLMGRWMYSTDLFSAETIRRMSEHFQILFEHLADDVDRPIEHISILSSFERQKLLSDWNAVEAEEPEPYCLHQIFEQQVRQFPSNVALVHGDQTLTYQELDTRSNQVARYLQAWGIGVETLVGFCMERSLDMIVGLLGILKVGGTYVPIDPMYPQERSTFILHDIQASVIVTQEKYLALFSAWPEKILCLDRDAAILARESDKTLVSALSPENIAYVIYTSGSTGQPKGVTVSHNNVVRLFKNTQPWFHFSEQDVWALFHSYAFDFSVWEIWGALLYGGQLVIVPYAESRTPEAFYTLLSTRKVTVLNQTPSAFRQFMSVDAQRHKSDLLALRLIIFGGEILEFPSLSPWFERHDDHHPRLINMYGITETTVHVTYYPLTRADVHPTASRSIGKRIPDVQTYILDRYLQPVPIGVIGELYVGGAGVTRGYLHQPMLTAERFIPHPFSTRPGTRLYKTGDLGRYLPAGDIEYCGRTDTQVKIRGHRIELGEIEAILRQYPSVKDVVVTTHSANNEQDKRLAAHIVLNRSYKGNGIASELREFLKQKVPDYMLPSAFVVQEQLPLTSNGKVNRKALTLPDTLPRESKEAFVPPRSPLEQLLAEMWTKTLGIEKVGVYDNFFHLGGDSIKGAIFINTLQAKLCETIYIVVLFDAPTIAALAEYLNKNYAVATATLLGVAATKTDAITGNKLTVQPEQIERFRNLIVPLSPSIERDKAPMAKKPSAIFVLAPPRSGTTLLRVMLGGHTTLFSPPELELLSFNTLEERKAAFAERDSFWLTGTIRAIMDVKGCDAEEARKIMDFCEDQHMSTKRFYHLLQEWIGERTLVDKTPSYALDINVLQRAETNFENAKYIHLLRSPQGMIRSFEEAKLEQIFFRYQHPFSRRELAELIWLVSQQNILQFLQQIPAQRQYRITFEDLVKYPIEILKELAAFLNLDFDPAMAQPYTGQRMTDGIYPGSRMLGDVKFFEHNMVDATVADKWKEDQSYNLLSDETWQVAETLGYKREANFSQEMLEAATPVTREGSIVPIRRVPREPGAHFPLSFAQEQLWFLSVLEPDSPFYNVPVAVRLHGSLDRTVFMRSINTVIQRHEVLRTTISEIQGKPVQVVHPSFSLNLPHVHLEHLSVLEREAEAWRLAHQDLIRPFALHREQLIRGILFYLSPDEHILFLNLHHVIVDGWSLSILVREIGLLYSAFTNGQPSPLPELSFQFADYAVWQRERLQNNDFALQMIYWKQHLKLLPMLQLPTDRPRSPVQAFRGANYPFTLSTGLSQELREFSRQEGVTLFMTLLATFTGLLSRYSGQNDIVIGSMFAHRTRKEIEDLIGMFVNTLIIRTDLSGNPSFRQILKRVRKVVLEAYANQDVPFEKLVEELRPERNLTRQPLFQVDFILQNAPAESLQLSGLDIESVDMSNATTKFDLTLQVLDAGSPDPLLIDVEYDTDLFEETTIARMVGHYHLLLEAVMRAPEQPFVQIPLLTEREAQQLQDWNALQTAFPHDTCIHHLFEEQMERTPDAVALVFEEEQLTYQELNARSNQLAHYLQRSGVGPDGLVGICLERSLDLVISLLGVLKAGGAYLPLEPAYPEERLIYMLKDSQALLLITRQNLLAQLPHQKATIVCVDTQREQIAQEAIAMIYDGVLSSHPSYVIYTSGSTGHPKGVKIPHRGLINRLWWMQQTYQLSSQDRVLQKTPFSFDVSVWEFFWPLFTGACLVVARPEGHKDSTYLVDLIVERAITTLHFVPSMLRVLLEEPHLNKIEHVRQVFCSGEELSPQLQERFFCLFNADLYNLYGPTEASIDVTAWKCRRDQPGAVTVPIGRPIANSEIYLLDTNLELVPIGVTGELYIGGVGLASEYLHRPALTAEYFIPHRFSKQPGSRIYRTGDLGRYRTDGTLEFLGRVDQQVKIRGNRIELGEIETVLQQHPLVQRSIVLVQEDIPHVKRLISYIVTQPFVDGQDDVHQSVIDRISDWQGVFDTTYDTSTQLQDPTFNIVGWNSSYTDQPIPSEHMQEWVDQTIERISQLNPDKVLEIGCGTGLLLFHLAPQSTRYYATDFSAQALASIEQTLSQREDRLAHVVLSHRQADDLTGLEQEHFDTVIINSVVQYFPSIAYLMQVLQEALKIVQPGGSIFIGDVRNLLLLQAFHTSVELYRAPSSLSLGQLQQHVETRIALEKELIIDPAFFLAFKRQFPQISNVMILPKQGSHDNEMVRYRYDVILCVGFEHQAPETVEWLDGQSEGLSLATLRDLLQEREPVLLCITNIPNKWLVRDNAATDWLTNPQGLETVDQLRQSLEAYSLVGIVDPQEWRDVSRSLPYTVELSWASTDSAGRYAIILRRNSSQAGQASHWGSFDWPHALDDGKPWSAYANNPLQEDVSRKLVPLLRSYLQERLPEYMVPSSFITIKSFPLMPNGKINRQALPHLNEQRLELESPFVASRTSIEHTLAQIWAQVLQMERVGIYDNFFDLGGDSILSMQVVARARQLKIHCTPKHILQYQTIAELAKVVTTNPLVHTSQHEVVGDIPLTPIQQWFFEQHFSNPHYFNQSYLFEITHAFPVDVVERAVQYLLEHHDVLRARFVLEGSNWKQNNTQISSSESFSYVSLKSLREEGQRAFIEARIAQEQTRLHLSRGPLLRVVFFDRGQEKPSLLLFVIHHLVIDGVSWRILIEDFQDLCQQLNQGLPLAIPAKTSSFQEWAQQLVVFAQTEKLLNEREYWLAEIRHHVRPLPVDKASAASKRTWHAVKAVSIALSVEETQALLHETYKVYHTEVSDLLLTALASVLTQWSKQDICLVDIEGHGREELVEKVDISRTVGWFTTIFPLVLDMSGCKCLEENINVVKKQTKNLPNAGIGYGLLQHLHKDKNLQEQFQRLPQAQISFNYLGQFDQILSQTSLRISEDFNIEAIDPQNGLSYLFHLNCLILNGQFQLAWLYDEQSYHQTTVEALAHAYQENLTTLIAHCQALDAEEYMTTDFPLAQLNEQDLINLSHLLDKAHEVEER